MVRSAILLTLAGVILGCNTRESTISERDSNPAIKAAVDATKIPVLYCPHFHPAKLTETQLNSVLTLTAESQYDSPIWFIFVWYHHNGHYRVEVFYVPDHDDALRRGKSVFIDSHWLSIRHQLARQLEESVAPKLHEYVQIPPSDRIALSTPALRDIPFAKPDWLSDEQILLTVAAARMKAEIDGEETDLPVYRIEKAEPEDQIRVYFGWQVNVLNGRGIYVDLQRSGSGYVPRGRTGYWVS